MVAPVAPLVLYHHLVQPLLVALVVLVSYGPLLILVMAVVAVVLVSVQLQMPQAALVEGDMEALYLLQVQQPQAEAVFREQAVAVAEELVHDQVVCHHQILAGQVVPEPLY